MKTLAILLIASGTLVANHSFAQVRLGGGARPAAGASVSTPGVSHAMRTTTAAARSTSQATVNAGHQAEVKTVSTTDKTVHAADQTAVNGSAKVEASANGAEKQTASAAQAAGQTASQSGANAQTSGSTQAGGSTQSSSNGSRPASKPNSGANVKANSNVNGQVNTNSGPVKTSTDVHAASAASAAKQ